MTTAAALGDIIGRLDAAGIPHMLAGSFSSSLHGLARSTAGIEVVIDPMPDALDAFISGLDRDRYYLDPGRARSAVMERDQFNVIDVATSWKFDLIIRKAREFSVVEFDRRRVATVAGVTVSVATAEDTILAKLEWARDSGSDRQLGDVAAVIRAVGPGLDLDHLRRWSPVLGVAGVLERLLAENAGTA